MMNPRLLPSLCVLAMVASCQTLDQQEAAEKAPHLGVREVFTAADLNADGKLSPHEIAVHHHQDAVQEYDLDNDRHISRAEWTAAHPSTAESDERFNHMDKDSNGHVSKEEAALFVTEHVSFGDKFKAADANGDFYLHWEEIDQGAPAELNITLFSLHPNA